MPKKKKKQEPKRVSKLPKSPTKGKRYIMKVNPSKGAPKDGRAKNLGGPRDVVFEATGKSGFGKYKIIEQRSIK